MLASCIMLVGALGMLLIALASKDPIWLMGCVLLVFMAIAEMVSER